MIKELENFPGYKVTTDGHVLHGDNEVKGYDNCRGYLAVPLRTESGKVQQKKIHRLIAEAFIPNENCAPIVNHKDGNKKNNAVKNLEWVSHRENSQHYAATLKRKKKPVARVNPKTGTILDVFISASAAARYLRINYRSLYNSLQAGVLYRGEQWIYFEIKETEKQWK